MIHIDGRVGTWEDLLTGNIEIMINKAFVLVWIKQLKEGGCRVAIIAPT